MKSIFSRNLFTVAVLCALPLLACTIDVVSIPSVITAPEVQVARYQDNGFCLRKERRAECVNLIPRLSCVQYKNGIFGSDLIDRCQACHNKTVRGVQEGCCAQDLVDPPVSLGACTPDSRQRFCYVYNPVPSCVCYFNGTCVDAVEDSCSGCRDQTIFSINPGICTTYQLIQKEDLCLPQERLVQCIQGTPILSCVCSFNGTCITKSLDRCSGCLDQNTLSITKGCCRVEGIPEAEEEAEAETEMESELETEMETEAEQEAESEPITLIKITATPEAETEPITLIVKTPEAKKKSGQKTVVPTGSRSQNIKRQSLVTFDKCRKTPLKKCNKENGSLVRCSTDYSQGCVCYNNGTCIEGPVNPCIQCQLPDVFSAEIGTKCPCKNPDVQVRGNDKCINKKIDTCPVYPSNVAVDCPTEKNKGCVCYKDGTCREEYMNPCSVCLSSKNVIAAQGGTKCPCPGIQV